MSLFRKITDDLTSAMKARDELRVSCLRMLKTGIKNRQIEKGAPLEDDEIGAIISSQVRRGRESAEEYRRGNRDDLAGKEEKEIEILSGYLPEQLSSDKIEEIVKDVITELSAESLRDMGRVMKSAMSRTGGRAQGNKVSEIVKRLLSQSVI